MLASNDPTHNSYFIACSRQYGKSFLMFLIACELSLRKDKQTQVFIGPLKSQVNEVINGNTFGVIFATCPKELQPKYDGSALIFPNGSRIRLAGTDNKNYSNLRGGAAHNIFMDEICFMSDLDSGVLPTVEPMTKMTGGRVIMASTPPDTLDHDSIQIMRDHDELNLISTFTIYDDKTVSEAQLQKIINQCKGITTTKFRREYLCERIVDGNLQVIPELTNEHTEKLKRDIKDDPLKKFWLKYVVADTGVTDKTAVIFAHYNYREHRLIVEEMLDLQGNEYNTSKLADMIKNKVIELWPDTPEPNIRYIADSNNKIVINDLNIIYNLPFIGTSKGRLVEMIQKVRDWVFDEKVVFEPNAEEVLKASHYAVWNRARTEFNRSPVYGHYDALAALTYLIRNVDTITDPVPGDHGFNPHTQWRAPWESKDWQQQQNLNKVFGRKGK